MSSPALFHLACIDSSKIMLRGAGNYGFLGSSGFRLGEASKGYATSPQFAFLCLADNQIDKPVACIGRAKK